MSWRNLKMKHPHPFDEICKTALRSKAEDTIKNSNLETLFLSTIAYLSMLKLLGFDQEKASKQQATYMVFKSFVELYERTYPDEQINFNRPKTDSASEGTEEASTQE